MLSATLKRLGCCGVLVWLAIAGTFATFFIGEYLERPEEDKSFWKAGVQVQNSLVFVTSQCYILLFTGYLLHWVNSRDRGRPDSLHLHDIKLHQR